MVFIFSLHSFIFISIFHLYQEYFCHYRLQWKVFLKSPCHCSSRPEARSCVEEEQRGGGFVLRAGIFSTPHLAPGTCGAERGITAVVAADLCAAVPVCHCGAPRMLFRVYAEVFNRRSIQVCSGLFAQGNQMPGI